MSTPNKHFAPLARLLHWLMALMIIAMLFIGAGLAASVSERHEWLLNLHKPLGIAILLLVIVRLFVRFTTHQPALPADLPAVQVLAAKLSHLLLYALMFSLPLIGWAMISAAGDPVMLSSSLQLPSILPANPSTFSFLRKAHTYLAYLLFFTVLAHLAAALFHGWVRRDGLPELASKYPSVETLLNANVDFFFAGTRPVAGAVGAGGLCADRRAGDTGARRRHVEACRVGVSTGRES